MGRVREFLASVRHDAIVVAVTWGAVALFVGSTADCARGRYCNDVWDLSPNPITMASGVALGLVAIMAWRRRRSQNESEKQTPENRDDWVRDRNTGQLRPRNAREIEYDRIQAEFAEKRRSERELRLEEKLDQLIQRVAALESEARRS
jgi:hypothetical protein